MFWKKLSGVLGSQNALISYVSIVLLGLTTNGVVFEGTPEEVINMFTGKDAGQILTVLLLNFINPLTRLVKKIIDKEWSWDFLNSENFRTNVLTVLTLVLSAFIGAETTGLLLTLGLQVYNFVAHLFKK